MDSPYYGSSESDSEYDDDFFLGEQYDPLFSCTYNSYRDSHRQRSNDLLDGLLGSAPAQLVVDVIPMLVDFDRDRPDNSPALGRFRKKDDKDQKINSLIDMSAKLVGKSYSCEQLENHHPTLDESLLKKVAYWAFPQDESQVETYAELAAEASWQKGITLLRGGKVREMWQVGFMATGYISKFVPSTDHSTDIRVSLTFEKQKITSSSCSECLEGIWCAHVIAAIVFRITQPEKVRVHAPMTETLSTLNRDQLQKLLQYAVQEDPAGILGKVFKNLDDIRDSTSNINAQQGAPDPTFGQQSGKSQWDLSVERLLSRFTKDLTRLFSARGYSSGLYPETFDLSQKVKAKMYQYLRKILELERHGQQMDAVLALIAITRPLIKELKENTWADLPSLKMFTHDLIHHYTLLLMDPNPNIAAREMLIAAVHEFSNEELHSSISGGRCEFKSSKWAELPSLCDIYPSSRKESKNNLFREPMLASHKIDSKWPPELLNLLDGTVSSNDSTYDENVVVMLLRMEVLLNLEQEAVFVKMGRLAPKLLNKLAEIALEDSIIGAYLADVSTSNLSTVSILKSPQNLSSVSKNVNFTPPETVTKGRKRGKRQQAKQGRGKRPLKKMKTSCKTPESCVLSKGQVAYSMLFVAQSLAASERVMGERYEGRHWLVVFCLLALEASRHRLVSPRGTIQENEHSWILLLENKVMKFLQRKVDDAQAAVGLFLDSLVAVGGNFYENCYPLSMLDALLDLTSRIPVLKKERGEDVASICAYLLQNLNMALEQLTAPMQSPSYAWSYTYRHHSPQLHDKMIQVALENFLFYIRPGEKKDMALFCQVLQQLQLANLDKALWVLTKTLRQCGAPLWSHKDSSILKATFKFMLHVMKRAKTLPAFSYYERDFKQQDFQFLKGLAFDIGISSLTLLLPLSQDALSSQEIAEILLMFEDNIQQGSGVPADVKTLVQDYMKSKDSHGMEACKILGLYKPGDDMYTFIIQQMLTNGEAFPPDCLFKVAQLNLKNKNPKDTALSQMAMDSETLRLVQIAFSSMATSLKNKKSYHLDAKLLDYIDWVCTACAKTCSRKGKPSQIFSCMLVIVSENAKLSPDIVSKVLENLKSHSFLSKHCQSLALTLVESYQNHFSKQLASCTHGGYAGVINEMQRARMVVRKFVDNGESSFKETVVQHIRDKYRRKKKLIGMLDNVFGDL